MQPRTDTYSPAADKITNHIKQQALQLTVQRVHTEIADTRRRVALACGLRWLTVAVGVREVFWVGWRFG